MFKKILIANRGEIAMRIIRACREMGIKTVAVYSSSDESSLHNRLADEAICIGPGKSSESYLNVSSIISAAEVSDTEAIHPGYGFLSESASFAEICENCGIKFIGPASEVMKVTGNKIEAKKIAEKARVPVLPWSKEAVQSEDQAVSIARKIGFPVMIKAAAGGGGRGMKVVYTQASIGNAFHVAKSEATASFGNGDLFIEKFCEMPRHIEIQIVSDEHGNAVQLGERDCSIQRRNQKILEESPSPFVTDKLRRQMGDAALRLIRNIGYTNAGTVEFLVDKSKNFYFMEINPRIQVEHPVTEMVTGIDLVKEQINIAMGKKLGFKQKHINIRGHSIECRINAEDPVSFMPSPGTITSLHLPGGAGIRVESSVYCNYEVPSLYDSLIAKFIVHTESRESSIRKMKLALDEFFVDGIKTNVALHKRIMNEHDFIEGNVTIDFLNKLKFPGAERG